MTTDSRLVDDDEDRAVLDVFAREQNLTIDSAHRVSRDAVSDGFVSGWEVTIAGEAASRHVYIESPARHSGHDGVLTLVDEAGAERAAWVFPADPALPALRTVAFPEAAAIVLERLGIASDDLRLRVLSYRPSRRAVVRVDTTAGTRFIKVVRPGRAEAIHGIHTTLLDAGLPVPAVLARSSAGLLVLAPLTGDLAVARIADADPDRLLAAIDDLRDRFCHVALAKPARRSLAARVDWYATQFGRLAPDLADRAASAMREARRLRDGAALDEVTIHGDLHLGQLMVDPEDPTRIVGVLDVDTSGRGDAADDDAAFTAHLLVTASPASADPTPPARAARELVHHVFALRRAHPATRRHRAAAVTAVHLLGHALGGHLEPGVALALAEVSVAAPDENPLITTSFPSHPEPPL